MFLKQHKLLSDLEVVERATKTLKQNLDFVTLKPLPESKDMTLEEYEHAVQIHHIDVSKDAYYTGAVDVFTVHKIQPAPKKQK